MAQRGIRQELTELAVIPTVLLLSGAGRERSEGEGVWKFLEVPAERQIDSPQAAVGLTTTTEGGAAKVEGHFNYFVLQAERAPQFSDGCVGQLERMVLPNDRSPWRRRARRLGGLPGALWGDECHSQSGVAGKRNCP